MISPEKSRNALSALHSILIAARSLAEQESSQESARVLDLAEYLVVLMQDEGDQTASFRSHLVELAREHWLCQLAVQRFDDASGGWGSGA
ncbi:hypothetical protein [Melittangium boletus]|uniref:hypothetical protein n=1 Tax=Melittangium boletus TaxID=83453 RepID=UPI003DA55E59